MRLMSRPTESKDFGACFKLMNDSFLYECERDRTHLFEMWRALLANGSGLSGVIEDLDCCPQPRLVGFGFAVFLTDKFVDEAISSPKPYISHEVLQRSLCRRSPVLSYAEIEKRNSEGAKGVNWLGLHTGWEETGLTPLQCEAMRKYMLGQLLENISGYKLRSFLKEIYSRKECEVFQELGANVLNNYGDFATCSCHPERQVRLVGLLRGGDSAPANEGRVFQGLFNYTPPRIHFTSRQREILGLAMRGWTDNEIALIMQRNGVRIMPRTVTAHLTKALERAQGLPGIFPEEPKASVSNRKTSTKAEVRGTGRRHLLFNYLRQHPEELRPHRGNGKTQ